MKDFFEDFEKEDKKNDIAVKKEQALLLSFIERQKMDIDCAKTMIKESSNVPSYLDKIHIKVKTIEQNFKNFKIKSRAAYEDLVVEENEEFAELQALEMKFD